MNSIAKDRAAHVEAYESSGTSPPVIAWAGRRIELVPFDTIEALPGGGRQVKP